MKVFSVNNDLDYQSVSSERFDEIIGSISKANATADSFGDIVFPEFYVHSPKKNKGNFYNIGNGLLFDREAEENLGELVAFAGEQFPVKVEEVGTLTYLNVLETCEALDHDKSVWRDEDDGSKFMLLDYAFHTDRFTTKSGLFKIAENRYSKVLAVTDAPGLKGDFYARYHEAGLTGLEFRLLWSDEA